MSLIEIREVDEKKGFQAFVNVASRLYKKDYNWVPPLKRDMITSLTRGKDPFWEHAKGKFFVLSYNGNDIARIAGIIDHNLNEARLVKGLKPVVLAGYPEFPPDLLVLEKLINCVKEYGRLHRMNFILGPARSLNDESGMLIEGFDSPPMIKMPYNPSYYPELWEKAGFIKAMDLYAFMAPIKNSPVEKVARLVRKLLADGKIKTRYVDLNNLNYDLRMIGEVYNDAWNENWDFSPMTENEVEYMAKQLIRIVEPRLCPMVFYKDEIVAMAIALPDYNQILRHLNGRLLPFGWLKFLLMKRKIDQLRVWALGTKNEFRNMGFEALLCYLIYQQAQRLGYSKAEFSWVLETNSSIINVIRRWGGNLYKKYRVYQLEI